MRILNLPVPNMTINCKCGCEFEWDPEDVSVTTGYYDNDTVRVISVYCPFCTQEHILQKPKFDECSNIKTSDEN